MVFGMTCPDLLMPVLDPVHLGSFLFLQNFICTGFFLSKYGMTCIDFSVSALDFACMAPSMFLQGILQDRFDRIHFWPDATGTVNVGFGPYAI